MAGLASDQFPGGPARATAIRRGPDDPELRGIAAPVLNGDTIDVAPFGRLVRVPRAEHYVGRCDWHGVEIDLRIEATFPGARASALADAATLYARWPAWHEQLRALVKAELLPAWFEWNHEEPPIDIDGLMAMLHLEELWCCGGGRLYLTLDPSGQFTDHCVTISGTVDDGPEDANIEG